jgi:Cu-Zn family superoxide dismutase
MQVPFFSKAVAYCTPRRRIVWPRERTSRMNCRALLKSSIAALTIASLAGPTALVASAQEATPMTGMEDATPVAMFETLEVPLVDAEGNAVGLAIFSEYQGETMLQVLAEGLTPGEHGWHLHEFGVCDPAGAEPFASAGEHWNPTNMPHGAPDGAEHHAGDFGNFTATEDGLVEALISTSDFTLSEGPNSVFDADGTAIILHEGQDDLTTQPSGNSGARFACGVVAEPMAGMATPMAGMATPMASEQGAMAEATPMDDMGGMEATPAS